MPISTDKKWLKGRSKYMTGFCNDYGKPAQCEGTKPKTASGKPMPTCEMVFTCPCNCHQMVDLLFSTTGMERKPVPNPEYVPEKADFVIPTLAELRSDLVPSMSGGVTESDELEGTAQPQAAPVAAVLATVRTPTGRAARGGLEAQVLEAVHALDGIEPLTPKLVGEWIAGKYKIPTPSSGAIRAVWIRWDSLKFASHAQKPLRFTGFTENDGSWETLQRLKDAVRSTKRSAESKKRRGFR